MSHLKHVLWLPYILLYIVAVVLQLIAVGTVFAATTIAKFLNDTMDMIQAFITPGWKRELEE